MEVVTFSVTGEVSLDRLQQPGLPEWEGLGGCATYLSLTLARQGHQVQFATAGGHDVPDRYLTPLREAGVDLHLQTLDGSTAHLELDYDRQGEIVQLRFESGVERSMGVSSLPPDFWSSAWVLAGTSPHEFQRSVIARGKAEGCLTALSTQGEFDGQWAALRPMLLDLDVLFVNSREVVNLRGSSLRDELNEMLSINPRLTCLVTCGERGAFVTQADKLWWVRAFRIPVINSTGAGDTFAATWLGAFAEGLGMQESMSRAAVAASMSLRAMAHTAIPTRQSLATAMSANRRPQVVDWTLADDVCVQALNAEDQLCHWTMSKSVA